VEGLRGPLNVYALPGVPPITELERLGVARVSIGGGPDQACLALLDEIANGFLAEGTYAPFLKRQLSFAETQVLLGESGDYPVTSRATSKTTP
jgi:2-methylisocitrate lyase-like PEP mutase family enzyme